MEFKDYLENDASERLRVSGRVCPQANPEKIVNLGTLGGVRKSLEMGFRDYLENVASGQLLAFRRHTHAQIHSHICTHTHTHTHTHMYVFSTF